jgi:hypothetical protein
MQGSIYPNGVLVDTAALTRTELTKAQEILRNRTSWTTGGVFSGGVVTANSGNTDRVDITACTGFTPSGEFVESPAVVNQPLQDYTAGVLNYVLAVYTESSTGNKAHETDGYSYPTKSEASYRIRIYSETNYNALPTTDENLSNDSIDRSLVLAIVQAEGTGAALTNIQLPTAFNNVYYTDPILLTSISGVTILSVSQGTPEGDGSLEFDDTLAPTYRFRWAANGASNGGYTTLTTDGDFTVTDASGNSVNIRVAVSQFPLVGGTLSETVTVYNLYEQDIPRISAEDHLHRNYTGTGIVTTDNPHGLSYDDLFDGQSGSLQEHQDIQHCNGLWRGSVSYLLQGSVNVAHPVSDVLTIAFPSSDNIYYINGRKLNSITSNSVNFDNTTYGNGNDLYEIFVDDDTTLIAYKRASFPLSRNATGTWIVDMSDDHPAGSYNFSYSVSGGSFYTFSWDGGPSLLIDNTTPPSANDIQIIRLYRPNNVDWIDVAVNRVVSGLSDAQLAGTSQTDSVTVQSPKDYDQHMKILSAPYWYDGTKGSFGYRDDYSAASSSNDRYMVDKRPWGNLCSSEVSDEGLNYLAHYPQDELHTSGILAGRNTDYDEFTINPSSLNVEVVGGSYYIRGKRIETEGGNLSLQDAKTYVIYADDSGVIQTLNITDDFSGSIQSGVSYLLGDSLLRNTATDVLYVEDNENYVEKGVPLWVVVTSGSVVSDYYNISRNVNGPVDPWSVGGRGSNVFTQSLAAFDNLSAAFLYADIYKDIQVGNFESIEIKITGIVEIDRAISQSSHVNVRGNKVGDNLYGLYVSHTGTTGTWELNDDCIVDGLNILISISK